MSILIRGMEMPKEKKITLTLFPDGRVYENHGERLWGNGKDCIPWKAVPVPPHGDLIERKAIYLTDFEIAMCDGDYKEGMKMLLEKIESAPTIIPAAETEP